MKRLFAIVLICVLVPGAYGETINYEGGTKYIGEWNYGRIHGHGIYTWPNGSQYVGEFKDHKEWARIHYNADGTIFGTYSNGEWIPK